MIDYFFSRGIVVSIIYAAAQNNGTKPIMYHESPDNSITSAVLVPWCFGSHTFCI